MLTKATGKWETLNVIASYLKSDVLKSPRAALPPVYPNGLASVCVLDAAVVEPSLVEPAT